MLKINLGVSYFLGIGSAGVGFFGLFVGVVGLKTLIFNILLNLG